MYRSYTIIHIRYIYSYTYIGFMHAYYVHIANIHPYMSHTDTKHENTLKLYIHKYITYYIYRYIHIRTCTDIYLFRHCYMYIRTYAYNVIHINFTNKHQNTYIHALHTYMIRILPIYIDIIKHTHTHMVIHTTSTYIHTHTYIRYIHRYYAHIRITHPYTLNNVH